MGTFFVLFYFREGSILRGWALSTLSETVIEISEKLDNEIRTLDTVSLNVLYSEDIGDQFFGLAELAPNSPEGISASRRLNAMLYAIIGPNHLAQQINLYDDGGTLFGAGLDNRHRPVDLAELPWRDAVMRSQGAMYVSDPISKPELTKFATSERSVYFISLCRALPYKYSKPRGILEVVQYYDDLFATTDAVRGRLSMGISIRVYNDRGVCIFPLRGNEQSLDGYYRGVESGAAVSSSAIVNPISRVPELIRIARSDYTGWTTMSIADQRQVFKPVLEFTLHLVVIFVLVLISALLLSFIAAKAVTVPVAGLRDAIRTIQLEGGEPGSVPEFDPGFDEIRELKAAFNRMSLDIRASHLRVISAKEQEMHARMLALQSQMNPHFLYNVLSNIGAMAEEGMLDQVVEMSAGSSRMLRYISSDSLYVTLEQETAHIGDYLRTMRLRYGAKLRYTIDAEPSVMGVSIPKLVIQPLVENALKYSTTILPPWEIGIAIKPRGGGWEASVRDNGPGFDPAKLGELRRRMKEIDELGILRSFEIEGMGMINVYARLRLSYGTKAVMFVDAADGGGAIVTIGGPLAAEDGGSSNASGRTKI
jgi:two-component system, sensor histidine kinase YesM